MAKTCNNCNSAKEMMELKDMPSVPFAAHEAEVGRQERQIKRQWIAIIVLAIAWFLTNMIWIGVFSSYDYSSEEVIIEADQDGEGVNIVGGGNVDYGAEGEDNNSQEEAD